MLSVGAMNDQVLISGYLWILSQAFLRVSYPIILIVVIIPVSMTNTSKLPIETQNHS